ncbi:hypothetical protein ACTXT7_014207 [Hymenolepis weldensis]
MHLSMGQLNAIVLRLLRIPLEFIRELPSVKITSAPTEPIVLECELSRKPRDSVKWLKNGKALPSRLPSNITIDEKSGSTVHSISISKVTEEDLGEYTVQVESISSTGKLDMQVAPTLRLSENFEDTIVMKAGSSTVVEIPFVASPKPTVKWSWKPAKAGSQETTPRFKPDVAAGLTSLPIGKVKGEDAGDYSVKISNELGDVSVTVHLLVLDKPSPPLNLEVIENTGDTVFLKWEEPEFFGDVRGTVLDYILEMREPAMRSSKLITKTTELQAKAEGLRVDKSYVFSVAAKNSVGQSDFVETKPISTRLAFGTPATPNNVRAKVTPEKGLPTDQIIVLSWDQPLTGSVTSVSKPEYLIEMKQEGTDRWVAVSSKVPIKDTTFIIPLEMMAEGKNYQFRVAAKNKAGASQFSEPSPRIQKPVDVVFIRELSDINLEDLPSDAVFECEVSKPGMTLQWAKDGVEIKPDYRNIYEIVGEGPSASMVHRLKVSNVGPGDQGVYAAQLINGLTSSSQLTINSPPTINYGGKKIITIAANKSAIVEVPYSGAPAPKVNWSFNGGSLPFGKDIDKAMASTQTIYGLTSLQLRRVDHTAEGRYLVQISNEFGKTELEIEVQVLDVPQPVVNLKSEMVKGESKTAKVTWEPPKKDGGMPISCYVLEKREGTKRTWTPVGKPSMDTKRIVPDLKPGQTYFFRVLAQNPNGWSEPEETKIPLRVEAASKPPITPDAPKVDDVTSISCKVTIEPPSSDGGSPITYYHLEKRSNQKGNWVRSTKNKIPASDASRSCTVLITDLIPDNVYEFRVAAENADALTSEFSLPSFRISTKPPFNVPDRPLKPEIVIATENSATINWNPPYNDGGDKVKRYVVQYKTTDGTHWETCEEEPIDCQMTIVRLQPDSEYEFRVAAINSAGTSEFSLPSEPYTPQKAVESAKPTVSRPLENVTIVINTPIELECSFKLGEPKATYHFKHADDSIDRTTRLKSEFIKTLDLSKPLFEKKESNCKRLFSTLKDDKPARKFTTSSPADRNASLKTNRAQLEDAGIYTCKAENAAGTATTTCRVTVTQKPAVKLEHPRGASEKVTGRISDGKLAGCAQGKLVIEAICEAVPGCEELIWLHNGQPLVETPRRSIVRSLGDIHPKERPTSPIRTRERLTINALEQSDTGVYRVEAKNSAGRADAAVTLVVTDRPQPPSSINVTKTRETDSCFIQWQRPVSDGGSKLTQYVVESVIVAPDKAEDIPSFEGNWTVIGKTTPSELEFKARNLKPDVLYAFRVSAENEVGRSEPTEIDTPIMFQREIQAPSEPLNVTATREGPRVATVKWEPPMKFDKRDLIGYVVEAREALDIKSSPPNRWTRVGPSTVRDGTKLHLTDINPNMDVQFRVFARTNTGMSEPSEPTDWMSKPETEVTKEKISPTRADKVDGAIKHVPDGTHPEDRRPKDIVEQLLEFKEAIKPKTPTTKEPPEIEIITDKLFKSREGTNLRVPLRVKSPVQATVELELESGRPLSSEVLLRSVVEQYGDSYYVNLKNLALTDTGHYRVKATNVAGSSCAPFELIVIAPPQTPKGPIEVKETKPAKGLYDGSTVEVTWKPPTLREGETPETTVTGYIVERKDGKRKDFGQIMKVKGRDNCTAVVEYLQPGVEYAFKVSAVNDTGVSEPLYSGPVTVKSPFDVPGICKGPLECTDKSTTSLVLNWKPPENDGGLPIKKYHLERNEIGSPDGWQPLATVTAPTTSYAVSDLRESIAYRFRVRAVNEQGNGDWLSTETSVSLNRHIGPPSEPEKPLRVAPVDDNTAKLSWRPPFDDGGSPVSTYIVEASRTSTGQWEELGTTKDTELKATKLTPDDTYTFRVSARNEAGKTGESLYSVPYKPSAPPTAPGKPTTPFVSHPLEAGQMVLDWGPSPVGGTSGYGPPSEYRVERWEPVKDRWVHVARKSAAEGTTVLVSGLKPGESYKFRVFAENAAGTSEPLEMDKPVLAVSPYSPPSAPGGPMHISEVQKGESVADGSARLSWKEPIDNGGLPLTGYIVQMRYANTTAWHKVTHLQEPSSGDDTDVILPTSTPVTGLKRSTGYYFRVAAINRAGTGPFLESELFEMPEDESCRPKAEWIRVVGKGADSVTVEWLIPHDCRKDHGPKVPHHLALDGFRVYVKDEGLPNTEWKPVTDLDHYMNRLVVGGLSPDKSYYFGVAALNQMGPGEIISTAEPVSPEAITTVPGQPVGPLVVSDITQDSCILNWKAPYSDGGVPITGYTIFKREMFRRSKQEVGSVPVTPGSLQRAFEFKVPYLMEGTSYEFQVVAENKNGFSEPLVTAADVHPRKMTEPPGAPRGPLYIRDHDIGEVELAWAPPANTGGLPIKGYKLEMREGRSFTWRTYPNEESIVADSPLVLADPKTVVSGIKPNMEYFFRVSAINSDGIGQPLTATDSYVKRVRLEPPKRVTAKLAPPTEAGPSKIEVMWTSPEVPNLNGFSVEMIDTEDIRSKWVPMDFIPKLLNEHVYTYRATAPRLKSVYKFRVNAVYPEGKSDWVESDFVLASEPTKETRVPPPITEAKFVPSAATPGGRIPATLRWESPESGDVESIRGYAVESWDTKRKTWKPVAHVPKEAPRELTFELPPSRPTPLIRITTMGDTTKSTPFEVPLERAKRIERTGEIPSDWIPLPSMTGSIRPEYKPDEELAMARTGAATPMVSEFILQRRQAALDMIRRTTATPKSAGIEREPLERFFTETPLIESLDLRPTPTTPYPLERLKVTDLGKTTATVEWPGTGDQSGFTVERWRPTSGQWIRLAEVPPTETRYVVPLTDIPQTPRPGEELTRDLWVRVVPRDEQGRPSAPAFQLKEPISLPGGEFVPSSVWGVDMSPVGGALTPGRPIDVSWRPPSFTGGLPLTGYKLVLINADTEEQKVFMVSPKTTTHRLEGLNPQNEYRVSITALNRMGESLPVTSTVPKPPSWEDQLRRPPAPIGIEFMPIMGSSRESKSGVLSWRPGSRVGAYPTESYVIEKWDSRSKQWVPFKKVRKEVTEITIPHLLDDVVYTFRVRAQNEAGLSEPGVAKEYFSPGKPPEELLFPSERAPPAPPRGPLVYEPMTSQQRLDLATEQAIKMMEFRWEEPLMSNLFTTPRFYVLEARRVGQQKWSMVGRRPIPEGSRLKVSFGTIPPAITALPDIDLSLPSRQLRPLTGFKLPWLPGEPKDYEYRLLSENEYGVSEPIYMRPPTYTPVARPYSPIKSTAREPVTSAPIEPPRGPISVAPIPSRPLSRRGPETPDLQFELRPTPDVQISWKPPISTQNLCRYEISYREPFRNTWKSLGTVDATETSFRIPRTMLRELPETLHLGISAVVDSYTRATPYLSPRLEDTILLPKPKEEDFLPQRELATPITPAHVSARVVDGPISRLALGVPPRDEVEISWSFPEAKRMPTRPEGYIAFYRELGSQQWQEIDRFPMGRPKDTVVLHELPRDTTMFLGVAPLLSGRIGPIVSAPDTIRLPGREPMERLEPLFERKQLEIRPISAGGIEVTWAPPPKINDLLALSPGMVPKYELQVRYPGEGLWRSISRPAPLDISRRPVLGEKPVTFNLHDLHPGDRLELRLLAYPGIGKKPIQVTSEQTYKFISPYDIPAAPRGPLVAERKSILSSRLPTMSPLRKPTGDFDELLYRLSTFPGTPLTHKPNEGHETPVDTVSLSWRPPEDTGGLPITHYLIERRPYDRHGLPTSWLPVMTVPADQTSARLLPELRRHDAEPSFYRVRAVNAMGPGLPLETFEPIIMPTRVRVPLAEKEPIQRLPEAPMGPLRADILPDSMVSLRWEAPKRYTPLRMETPLTPQKYIIEATLADDSTAPWIEVGKVPSTMTAATVRIPSVSLFRPISSTETPILRPLLYRVRAENMYGYSAPLTARVRPDYKTSALPSRLLQLPDGPVQARILEPQENYEIGVPPSLELKWAPFVPPAVTPGSVSDRYLPFDYSYNVEYRPVGDLGWRHLATLPLGHERYTFYPPAPTFRDLEHPKSEAYQFRVGVRGPVGMGDYRDSNIVSWNYRVRTPYSMPLTEYEPISVPRAPIDMQFVHARVDTPKEPYMTLTGSIALRWSLPSFKGVSPPEGYVVERWLPDTSTWRTVSHKLEDRGHGVYEATLHVLPVDEPHFIRVSTLSGMRPSEPATLPYPIWISAPQVAARPEPPRHLEVTPILRDRPGFLLAWTPPDIPNIRRATDIPTMFTGYVVEYRPTGGDWKLLADLPSWQTSLETTKIEPGRSYDFRIMSKGPSEPVASTPTTYRRRTLLYPETPPTTMSQPLVSGPHTLPKETVPPPSLSGLLDVSAVRGGVQLSWEPPREPPSGYVIELSSVDDRRHLWREISRIPSLDRGVPISNFLIRHLDADKSYRFRVIPYQDDIYGRPVESLRPFRPPSMDEHDLYTYQRPIAVPPPRGPVTIEELPSGQFRLSWRPPTIDFKPPLPGPISYVIEQRIPGRRQWIEISRTPNLSCTLDVDTTSQFRVRTLVSELSNNLRGTEYLIGSDGGPQSDWIRFEDQIVEPTRTEILKPTIRSTPTTPAEVPIPKRLYASHIGPSSVLLEWDYPKLPDHPTGYLYLEQRLIPDSKKDIVQPLWEPIARIPISRLKTSYEVTDLLPGRSYLFRLIDKYGGIGSSLVQREITLLEPIRTRGGELGGSSLPKGMEYLMMPRSFSTTFNSAPLGGLRFTWLPPESLESYTGKIHYRIEGRSMYDKTDAWRLVVKDIKENEYTLISTDLEKFIGPQRSREDIRRSVSTDWHFRIIATADGVDSHPKLLSTPVSITTEQERKPLRFVKLNTNRDIKCFLGQTLVITIDIEGSPQPIVSWYLNGIVIYPQIDSNYMLISKTPGVYELRINSIDYIHDGTITCKARNLYEEIEESWRIHIDAPVRFSRTVFLAGQNDHRVISGGDWNVRLPLDVPYHVTDSSRWVHRAWIECIWKPKRTSTDFTLSAERRAIVKISDCGRWLTLDLSEVHVQDEGLYRIWIENEAGRDYFDLRLHVDDKPRAKLSPLIIYPHGPDRFLLTWQPPSSDDAITSTGYRIEYISDKEVDSEDNWRLLGTTTINQNEVVIGSQLKPGERYRFRVRLQNVLGLGPASEPSRFISLDTAEDEIEDRMISRRLYSRELPIRFSSRKFEDRYEVIEELAKSKHAFLYRIKDRESGGYRIAKIMDLGDLSHIPLSRSYTSLADFRASVYTPTTRIRHEAEEDRRLRAERELKLLASTHHQNLAELRDVFVDAQRLIWVIDDMLPETLWDQIRNRITITESRAAVIMQQILSLLESMHSRNVAFLGGIDASDIFFADKMRKKIVLGGVPQYYTLTEDKPVRLTFRSTIYVPPELYSSYTRTPSVFPHTEISRATDVWSAGVLLYQMLTGDTEHRPSIEALEKLSLSAELLDFARKVLYPDPTLRPSVSEALKHPWISTERKTVDEIVSQSVQCLQDATNNAYKRLLRKIDWSQKMESDETEFVDEMEHEIRKKRRIIEYRKRRRMSWDEHDEERDYYDDGIAMNVFLRGRGRAPKIAVPMTNSEAYEGGEATLKCVLTPPLVGDLPDFTDVCIEWSVNGKIIDFEHATRHMSDKYSAIFDRTTGEAKLTVRNLSVYDAGTYVATFRGRFGVISESANLKVHRGTALRMTPRERTAVMTSEIGAKILRPIVDHTVVAGESLKFRIRVGGIPRPKCTWKRNGIPLDTDPTCRIQEELVSTALGHSNEIICTMEIRHTKPSDAGTYTVSVSNKNGSDSCSAMVNILPERSTGSSIPRFVTSVSNVSAFMGDTITLEAEVEGFPDPQIRWFKDGRMLIVGGRFSTIVTETNSMNRLTCRLIITNCLYEDTGAYVCAATSLSGTAISEATVIVRGGSITSVARRGSEVRMSVARSHPPEFVQRLKSRVVALGDSVRLSASVMATPPANIVWEKDDIPINTDSALSPYQTKNLNGNVELRIEKCTNAELGKYTVIAYNSAGEARSSCHLEKAREDTFRVPIFTRQLVDRYLISGQKAIFEVIAEGFPSPEFKEKDGLDVRPESHPRYIFATSATTGRATLTIPVVEKDDAGLYSCVAHNSVGRDRCACLIYVDGSGIQQRKATSSAAGSTLDIDKLPPQPSKLQTVVPSGKIEVVTDLPKVIEIIEGEELRLFCVVRSDTHLIPTWTKAGRTLTFDGRRRITRNLSGEMCLTIDQAMATDAGRYTLTITPSDATLAETMEPVVLNTRVDINPKIRSRVRTSEHKESKDSVRSTRSWSRRESSYTYTRTSRERSYLH